MTGKYSTQMGPPIIGKLLSPLPLFYRYPPFLKACHKISDVLAISVKTQKLTDHVEKILYFLVGLGKKAYPLFFSSPLHTASYRKFSIPPSLGSGSISMTE